jgi:hypothetical protein
MPNGWTLVDEPKGWTPVAENPSGPSLGESVAHAQVRGLKEGATQGASDLYQGTKEGLGSLYQMARHPLDTVSALGSGLKAGAAAAPDVARLLMDPATRSATAKGFTQGSAEGAAGVDHDATFSRKVGQFLGGTVIPAVAGAGAVKAFRIVRAGSAPMLVLENSGGTEMARVRGAKAPIGVLDAPAAGPQTSRIAYAAPDAAPAARPNPNAGGRLVPASADAPARAIADAIDAAQSGDVPRAVSLPPPVELPPGYTPRTSAPAPITQAARRAPKIRTVADAPVAPTPVQELPAAWRALVEESAPAAPQGDIPGIISKRTPKPQAVADARRALGSRDAAPIFDLSPADVRETAPGPSRRPLKAELADLDREYRRHLDDERGAVDPTLLRTAGLATGGALAGSLASDDHPLAGALAGALGGAALANPSRTLKTLQELRMTGMLSGAALPKSAAGNIGAILTAAAENGSLAPIKEGLRLPTNLANAATGFMSGSHPGVGPVGKMNVFGRAMSGLDTATTQALQRAGLSEAETQRLLLNKPGALGDGALGRAAKTPVGRAVPPFQNIPINTVAEGINSINELAPKSGASNTRRALTVGAAAAGAGAGKETDNPLLLGLMAALAGPRAVPFALGALGTGGPAALKAVSVGIPDASWKDLVDPLRPINHPALLRLIQTLNGTGPVRRGPACSQARRVEFR